MWNLDKPAEEWWEITNGNSLARLEVGFVLPLVLESVYEREAAAHHQSGQATRGTLWPSA
jgi:hypothetical protein